MGTNFYLVNPSKHQPWDIEGLRVGRRSAAGNYCFDCRTTLCKQGEARIHYSDAEWLDSCPHCGAAPEQEGLRSSTVGLELGFALPRPADLRKGVRSTSSFTWAVDPAAIEGKRYLWDEYGRRHTLRQFKAQVLDNCPIWYFNSIGMYFS